MITINVFKAQALVKAFILRNRQVYNLFLSKRYIYRVLVIKVHKAKTFTINGRNEHKRVVDGQKANFFIVKLMNLAEIEDLRINLTDKKIYQVINDANKTEYYYHQTKNSHL